MRVDKYLQLSQLVRRRVLAQRLCDAGRVQVNERRARPATPVAVGDILEVSLEQRRLRVRVLHLPASPREAGRTPSYEILGEDSLGWW
ncbi:MAG: S4 domain-containing protein [Armatimonadota bacterium]|nr:S4 domain-containing protein [Armatimonadota bacterium]MDR7426732.1 S4 domain-containing protein [Armatimonadota bacterium]MDR7464406.1 S4 domain-containing protein [Armatimonadota bacterium]MDR7475097.1 S4 domain-containing protein [Armatimonadota bacterium]MDR7540287.1 S4 domain-containing protein [Armatimonadota bacterium]